MPADRIAEHRFPFCRTLCMTALVWTAAVVPGRTADNTGWDSSLSLGATVTRGNSQIFTLAAGLNSERKTDTHEVRFGLEGTYGESEIQTTVEDQTRAATETTTQQAKALLKYKRRFGRPYAYSDNSLFHDDLADIDMRLIAGVGVGVYVLDTDTSRLSLELGGSYVNEDLATAEDDDYWAPRLGIRHELKLGQAGKLWAAAELLPRTDDLEDYLVNAEAGVEAALNTKVNLRLVAQSRYDSNMTPPKEKDDLSIVTAVVLKL